MKKLMLAVLLVAVLAVGGIAVGSQMTVGTDQMTKTTTDMVEGTTQMTKTPADMAEGMDENTDSMDEPISYMDITVAEAKNMIDTMPGLVIIDVSPVYDQGHIPGAVNYYVGDGSLDAAIPMLDKDGNYLVYCHTDSASMLGAQKLVDAGFGNVYRIEGNYDAWVDAGYPVEM